MYNGPVIVSACLLGLRTRYDGKDAFSMEAMTLLEGRAVVPVCPEQLGGLPTPRPKAAITSGSGADVLDGGADVLDENGTDVTEKFMKGAMDTLQIARLSGAREAYLKEKSPSCGSTLICRAGACVKGMGVTAALLLKEGLSVKGF
ncbi:hypothetical protein BAC1_00751 [uncultured bacterium]|nr:hypothetical protein BAC1_00751 [uncultured bacterium]